jgi:hypothetical protein
MVILCRDSMNGNSPPWRGRGWVNIKQNPPLTPPRRGILNVANSLQKVNGWKLPSSEGSGVGKYYTQPPLIPPRKDIFRIPIII